jgi:hypothetical protein
VCRRMWSAEVVTMGLDVTWGALEAISQALDAAYPATEPSEAGAAGAGAGAGAGAAGASRLAYAAQRARAKAAVSALHSPHLTPPRRAATFDPWSLVPPGRG